MEGDDDLTARAVALHVREVEAAARGWSHVEVGIAGVQADMDVETRARSPREDRRAVRQNGRADRPAGTDARGDLGCLEPSKRRRTRARLPTGFRPVRTCFPGRRRRAAECRWEGRRGRGCRPRPNALLPRLRCPAFRCAEIGLCRIPPTVPVCFGQTTWSTPSPVLASPTSSIFRPPGSVARVQVPGDPAPAAETSTVAVKTATAARRKLRIGMSFPRPSERLKVARFRLWT